MVDVNQLTPEQQFIKYHDKLRFELNNIQEHLEIYKDIAAVWKEYIKELNIAPTFFMMTVDAHKYAILMGLNRLLDTKPRHLSMRTFLDFIKVNLDIFSYDQFTARLTLLNRLDELALSSRSKITVDSVDLDIKKIQNLPIPNVRKWRNEILAHMQASSVLQDLKVSKLYPIKTSQIEKSVQTIHEVLNFYYVNFQSTSWAESKLSHGQIDRIVKAIRVYGEHDGR